MAATGKILLMVGLIVVLITWLAVVPTVVDQVDDINTTGWDFTGYEGAITLLDLIPFVFIASGLIMMVVGSFKIARGG